VTLGFSTYLGGSGADAAYGIAVDADGAVYVTGSTNSPDFPILDPSPADFAGILGDAFVAKFIQSQKGPLLLAYSAFIGGDQPNPNMATNPTAGTGIAIDPSGAIQLAGFTFSTNFGLLNAYQNTYIDVVTDAMTDSDGFAVKLPQPGTVVKIPVNITVTSPAVASSLAIGQPIELIATFSGASGPPVTGTVWFVGAGALCSAPISNGQASCTTRTDIGLPGAGNTITAGYAGDSVYTLGAVTPLRFPAATTTTLSVSPNPPPVGPVTLTATVSITQPGGVFRNTDTVEFTQDGFTICLLAPPPDRNSVTQFSVSCSATLGVRASTFAAFYSGNTETTPSSSGLYVVASRGGPIPPFEIHVSPAVAFYGQPVTISATSAPAPGSVPPTGTVTFSDLIGSAIGLQAAAPLTAGAASITVPSNGIPALRAGAQTITVNYTGDSNYGPVSGAATLVVVKADTAIALTAQGGTITAAVSAVPPGAGNPTGSIQFFNGSAPIGGASLVTSGAQSVAVLDNGPTAGNIAASYSGDFNFNGSTSAALPLPNPEPSSFATLTLAPNMSPARVGTPVTLAISVKGNAPVTPTGTVQVFDSTTLLGAAAVSGGQATLAVTFQTLGTHRLVAMYSGDSVYPPQSLPVSLSVLGSPVSVTLASNVANTTAGQPVTLAALVSGAAGLAPPSGTVQFLNGAAVIATGLLVNGAASVTVSTLAPGTHHISAFYGGDAVFGPALSAPLVQMVGSASTFEQSGMRGR